MKTNRRDHPKSVASVYDRWNLLSKLIDSECVWSRYLYVTKYLPHYVKGGKAQFIEATPFRTVIPIPLAVSEKMSEKTAQKILEIIQIRPMATIGEIAAKLDVATRTVERNIKTLQTTGRLRRIGPVKGGHWEVLPAPSRKEG